MTFVLEFIVLILREALKVAISMAPDRAEDGQGLTDEDRRLIERLKSEGYL